MAGMATFIGVMLDLPTIGITKNVLCGEGKIPEKSGEDSEKPFKMTKFVHTLFKGYLRQVIYWEVIRNPLE
jgi:deoxyinosine 3'endonuclease (endonuclease V)